MVLQLLGPTPDPLCWATTPSSAPSVATGMGVGHSKGSRGPVACLASIDDPVDDPHVVLWTQDVVRSKY